ncbi:MAG: GAF domain-containing protein [Anaerolineae bacterium]|nr:GAF domain-containing protein [Anaerolineae bacterium]
MKDQVIETDPLQEETIWRQRIFENVTRLTAIGGLGLVVVFMFLGLLETEFPARSMVGVAGAVLLFSLVSMIIVRRVSLQPAIVFYIAGLTLTTFAGINFTGGVTGPFLLFLIVFPVLAGQLGGTFAVRWGTIVVIFFWLVAMALEILGLATPVQLPTDAARALYYTVFPTSLLLVAIIVRVFVQRGQQSMTVVYERERALAESTRLAQAAAEAERESRARETRSAQHLRETVAGYAEYLSRVAAGDYTARVDVGELDENVEGDPELHALGEYLNTTVDALVAALTQSQEVQRRYAEQSWQTVVASGRVQPGFTYRQNQIVPEVGWLPQMQRAANSGKPVAEGEGVAVPLVINRQVVGALGGEHPDGRPWTEEELSLIEDVTGQLAQTIESLRLFDETQRRAVQERLVGEITARVRESLDMETVLKTAAEQIRQSLGAQRVVVQLAKG